jgi:hypothetical protein
VLQTPAPNLNGDGIEIAPICTGNPNQVSASISFFPQPMFNSGISEIIIDWEVEVISYNLPEESLFEIQSPLYSGFGSNDIVVDVIGQNGCVSTFADELFIGNNPYLGAGTLAATNGVCAPYSLPFYIINIEENDPETMYFIDFGDGSDTSLTHPQVLALENNEIFHMYTESS